MKWGTQECAGYLHILATPRQVARSPSPNYSRAKSLCRHSKTGLSFDDQEVGKVVGTSS